MIARQTFGRLLLLLWTASCMAADPFFLRRQLGEIRPQPDEMTRKAKNSSYKPVFGAGDRDAARLQAIVRCGELTVGPGGRSAWVRYPREERVYYVLEGSGALLYARRQTAVKKDDFLYLPAGWKHAVANRGKSSLRVLILGYRIPEGRDAPTPAALPLANAADVGLQVLASHGPTTQFKLLMGQTTSQRDKLASASEMSSLFIMDFSPGGTNKPHSHAAEEEIYLLLRGSGDMVAGKTEDGQDARHPSREGALFYFAPGTRVGYYSGAKEGQEHDLILAARSRLPQSEKPAAAAAR